MTISKFISSIILSIIAVGLGLLFYISSQEKKLESEISEIRASEEYKLVELFREECALLFNALMLSPKNPHRFCHLWYVPENILKR
jgi:hypothetical protein